MTHSSTRAQQNSKSQGLCSRPVSIPPFIFFIRDTESGSWDPMVCGYTIQKPMPGQAYVWGYLAARVGVMSRSERGL